MPDVIETVQIGEAAKRLGVSVQTARRLAKAGELPGSFRTREPQAYTVDRRGREMPGHWRIPVASIERYRRAMAKQAAIRKDLEESHASRVAV